MESATGSTGADTDEVMAEPVRRLWRSIFHVSLALLASPVPGGALVAVRLMAVRRWLASLAVLSSAVVVTVVCLSVAFLLPVSAPVAATIVWSISLVGGVANDYFERRMGAVPHLRVPGERKLALRSVLWGAVVPVAWVPLAWVIAIITSRWGSDLMGKPSLQGQILIAAAIWLVPFGVGLGIARAVLERRFSMGPLFVFAATLPTLFGSFGLGAGAAQYLPKLWLLTPRDAWPPVFGGDILPVLKWATLVILFLACAEYLSNAIGIRVFLIRAAVVGGLAFSLSLFQVIADSTLPVAVWEMFAYRNAAQEHEADAARDWARVIRRALISRETCHAIEQCSLAALHAGRPDMARWAFEQLQDGLTREFPCQRTSRVAETLLKSLTASTEASTVKTLVVRPETYLDNNWSAVLTAVRAARPDSGEVRLKTRLRAFSSSTDEIKLTSLDGFDDLRLVARLLDSEALVVPSEQMVNLLKGGWPLLFRDPASERWGIVVWIGPDAEAIEWLDFQQWDRDKERPLGRAEARQIVNSSEATDRSDREVRAEVRRLGAASLLRAVVALDGGWLAVIVPRSKDGKFVVPPGASLPAGDNLARLWEARHAAEKRAYVVASRLVASLPTGVDRSEVVAISDLGMRSRDSVDRSTLLPPEAVAKADALLGRGGLDHLSSWALQQLQSLGGRVPELSCQVRRDALERLASQDPDNSKLLQKLLISDLAEGRAEEAARVGLDEARADSFGTQTLLRVMEAVAPLAPEATEAKAVLRILLDHLPALASTGPGDAPRLRGSLAPYCAARAALSKRHADAIRWWRRAIDIDPTHAPYLRQLAALLSADARTEEAARVQQRFEELSGVERCSEPIGAGPRPAARAAASRLTERP